MIDTNQTRMDSWTAIGFELNLRQKQVLEVLKRMPLSNRELSQELCLPINSITPRVLEFRNAGFVLQVGNKFDRYTNRNVAVWSAK